MKLFLTGSSGYVGRGILKQLALKKCEVVCLIRKQAHSVPSGCTSYINGDILNPETYIHSLKSCDSVIYLPGLLREFPAKGITFENVHFKGVKILVDLCSEYNVKRFILMSANGVRENATTEYYKTKYRAEEYLKKSNLDWTIFRPSVIFGDESEKNKNFISVIINLLKIPLFFPVIGDGNYRFQPISLKNLADAVVMSLDNNNSIGKTYIACGLNVLTYNEIIDIVMDALGKKKIKVHLPIKIMKFVAKYLDKFEWFPFSQDQITMLLEENILKEGVNIFDEFPISPASLKEEINKTITIDKVR